MEPLATDVSWAAGFFEGEGSIVAAANASKASGKRQSWRLRVHMAQVDRTPLDEFQRIVGMGKVYGPVLREGVQPIYQYQLNRREDVEKLFGMLEPYFKSQRPKAWRDSIAKRGYLNPVEE